MKLVKVRSSLPSPRRCAFSRCLQNTVSAGKYTRTQQNRQQGGEVETDTEYQQRHPSLWYSKGYRSC